VTAETAAWVAPRETGRRISFGWLWSTALLLLLTFLVIYPVSMLVLGALTNTNPVVDGFSIYDLSLTNFITVLGNPNVHLALFNSLIACGGTKSGIMLTAAMKRLHGVLVRTTTQENVSPISTASSVPPPQAISELKSARWTFGLPRTVMKLVSDRS
jgi:iron(III) transport system permease protein